MRRALHIVAVIFVAWGFTACSDDSTTPKPGGIKVQVTVVDSDGQPLPDVLMNMVSDNPFLQDGKGVKASTVIQFIAAVETRVRVVIEDIEGGHVRTLVDDEVFAGYHQVVWDGKDDAGDRQYSGRYTVRMIAFERGAEGVVFEDTIDGLMCLLDPRRNPVGQTDENGRIVLTDKRLFPHMYDRDPMTVYDENGEVKGLLTPTAEMIFTLEDTVNGGGMMFHREINGSTSLEFVWRSSKQMEFGEKTTAAKPKAGPPPLDVFKLGPIYPNPFN